GQLGYSWRATREESIQALVDSARLVRERLRARGVEPQFFTTLRAVDDVYDVVRALGYERVVLFGGSYGTRVALQVMHRYPAMVEAAILDGVAPPPATELFDPEQLAVRRRAVAVRVVADCVRDPSCASEYRELKSLLSSLERPEAPPLHLVISLPPGGSWYNVNLN